MSSSTSRTPASSSPRWSRASASASTTRRATATRCMCRRQGVAGNRVLLATLLGCTADKVRILTGNVGGSFGMKSRELSRSTSACCTPRSVLGRPVKWTDDRSGSFLSDSHGRDQRDHRRARARRATATSSPCASTAYGNVGAYLTRRDAAARRRLGIAKNIAASTAPSCSRSPPRCASPTPRRWRAYRGAGRPEANYFMERLIDDAAARWASTASSCATQQPDQARTDAVQDAASGMMSTAATSGRDGRALEARRLAGFAQAQARKPSARQAARHRRRRLPRGHRAAEQGNGQHRRSTSDGGVTLHHRHARLRPGPRHAVRAGAVRPARRALRQDPPRAGRQRHRPCRRRHRRLALDHGRGAGDCRGVRARHREGQGSSPRSVLEASAGDIEFRDGNFRIAGTDRPSTSWISRKSCATRRRTTAPRRSTSITSAAMSQRRSPTAATLPRSRSIPTPARSQSSSYTGVNDFGAVVNPLMVAGQVHGGVAQGIGQALMECVSYDADGQPLTGSFMDYAMPRADDFRRSTLDTPSGAGDHQPARRQGLRRGRLRRQPVVGDERGGRRAVRGRRAPPRHAADAGAGVARDPGRQAARGGVDGGSDGNADRADFCKRAPA